MDYKKESCLIQTNGINAGYKQIPKYFLRGFSLLCDAIKIDFKIKKK